MAKVFRWSYNPNSPSKDRKAALLRQATTLAIEKYGIGNVEKKLGRRKKITLPKLKFMEDDPCE